MLLGKVKAHPQERRTKFSAYLEVMVETVDKYIIDGQQMTDVELHEVRVYGNLANIVAAQIEANDTVYIEGKLKSYERKFHIKLNRFQLVLKTNSGELLPPDYVRQN
jgi:single-stranded DNA-binding protein